MACLLTIRICFPVDLGIIALVRNLEDLSWFPTLTVPRVNCLSAGKCVSVHIACFLESGSAMFQRWLKFNLAGMLGVGVQLGTLHLLAHHLKLNYLVATAIAVEVALIHNFFWHERYTWKGRNLNPGFRSRVLRLVRFNLTNGLISLAGNLLLMTVLAGYLGWPYLLANGCSIIACSLANFYASERHVFVERARLP